MKKQSILDKLQKSIVLGAEGYVFELEKRGYIKAGPYVPEVVLDFPDAVVELHREFMRAGSDVIVALTYYANKNKLADVGRENDFEKLNRQAVRLARKVADEGDCLVAGNICNTWVYDPKNKKESSDKVRRIYQEQVQWAVEEGADFIISETNDYLAEAQIGLEVIKSFNLPALVSFGAYDAREETWDGVNLVKACQTLEQEGADIVGLNCTWGPKTILPIIKKIRNAVSCYVSAVPVPYRTTPKKPTFQSLSKETLYLDLEPFACTRFDMAEFAKNARSLGVNYIGGCCGTNPSHIRSMAEALGRTVASSAYSPDLAKHPVVGQKTEKRHRKFGNKPL